MNGGRTYKPSSVPYAPANCRSTKTAQPESLPPKVCGSGGMIRSAKASMARPSSGVKNTQGPSLTATGGLPPFGSHGSAPAIVLAVDRELVDISSAAVDRRRDLREATG